MDYSRMQKIFNIICGWVNHDCPCPFTLYNRHKRYALEWSAYQRNANAFQLFQYRLTSVKTQNIPDPLIYLQSIFRFPRCTLQVFLNKWNMVTSCIQVSSILLWQSLSMNKSHDQSNNKKIILILVALFACQPLTHSMFSLLLYPYPCSGFLAALLSTRD